MPIEPRVARRYFWFARRRMHTAMLAVISMLGLAIGVFALIVSIALLSGFQEKIKDRLIASSPQLLIEPSGSVTLSGSAAIVTAARRLGPRDIRPRSRRASRCRSARSEEHTSELQSHLNLVCRLLLEKKKKKRHTFTILITDSFRMANNQESRCPTSTLYTEVQSSHTRA